MIIDIENKRVETAATPYSVSQFAYLHHIRRQGFIECPAPIEVKNNIEVVSYVAGDDLTNMGAENSGMAESVLLGVCRQWQRLVEISTSFVPQQGQIWPPTVHENYSGLTPLHLDLNPGNVIMGLDGKINFIDFRNASLSVSEYDLALLVRHWGPFALHQNRF